MLNNVNLTINDGGMFDRVAWYGRLEDVSRIAEKKGIDVSSNCITFASFDFSKDINMDDVKELITKHLMDDAESHGTIFESRTRSSRSEEWGYSKYDSFDFMWELTYDLHVFGGGYVIVRLMSSSRRVFDISKMIQDGFYEIDEASREKNEMSLRAYWMGRHGPDSIYSKVKCPKISEVKNNYSADTVKKMNELVAKIESGAKDGKLIIWHGEPGTGKTWAIRSLIFQVRDKYTPIVINDSDVFLEQVPYYYSIANDHEKPCLFILEDSADGILTENRRVYGNRISRLLNLTDGLMAQGRGDLFLITFNEDVEEIDPAVVRPGRCLSIINFEKFHRDDAKAWLTNNGFKGNLPGGTLFSLAELYGILRGENVESHKIKAPSVIGFKNAGN